MRDHLSVSQINLYLMCPLKYRFQYVDELPRQFKQSELALGSSVHASVEWWHRRRLEGRSSEYVDVARVLEADLEAQGLDAIRFKDGDDLDAMKERGKQLLATYLSSYAGGSVHAVEMAFRVPLVDPETGEVLDLPLDGYFDLVEADDTLVELKTSARAYDPLTIRQHLQLTAYAYAYQTLYRRRPKLRLDVLVKTKRPRMDSCVVTRDQGDVARFYHIAKGVYRAIQGENFYPNQGWQCATCEYFEPCQSWRTDRRHQKGRAQERKVAA